MKDPNHTSVIETLGRNHLIAQLIEDDVHAAVPMWDQGVDLIAYYGSSEGLVARPLQLKVAEGTRWGVYQKYAKIDGLLMIYIWNVRKYADVEIYAMSYAEALNHLTSTGPYTQSKSWLEQGGYDMAPRLNNKMWDSLQPFRMTNGLWRDRLSRP
jgi:hypothetical protein